MAISLLIFNGETDLFAYEADFLSFSGAEQTALQNSHIIESQRFIVKSSKENSAAEQVKRYPQLNFDSYSFFISELPKISMPQLGINNNVGQHTNWSVGPTLDFVIWDTGQIMNMTRSLRKITDAQIQTLDYNARQVLLNVRTSYIGVQFAKEQVRLVASALSLAKSQYAVVLDKKNAGTADKLDLTVAHQEVVDREKDLETAKGEMAVAKRKLVAAIGYEPQTYSSDTIDVEPISNVLKMLLPKSYSSVDVEKHPRVQALAEQQRASELAAKSSSARHWPKVTMQGKASYDYPNFADDTTIQQNKLYLGLKMPLFDWGMISKETRSHKYQARSTEEQKKQTAIDISQGTSETEERIKTLKNLRVSNAKAVKDAVLVAKLTYDSYMAGRIIFLDVQKANVKALATQVSSAQNDAELAMQISQLLALAESEGDFNHEPK